MQVTKQQSDERDVIVFGKVQDWTSGKPLERPDIMQFEELSLDACDNLLQRGYMDPEEAQNLSPTHQQFVNFMKRHPDVKAHGYVVRRSRVDSRVSLEGLQYDGEISDELLNEFKELCCDADAIRVHPRSLFSWWD